MAKFQVSSKHFGSIGDKNVFAHTISSSTGLSMTITDYGATLLSVLAPDQNGNCEEVTLNYKTLDDMISNHGPYYGCVAGRVANRIAKGRFVIDAVEYSVAVNNGANHLHGGIHGFDQKVWTATPLHAEGSDFAGVELKYVSVDGEEGYPGDLEVSVRYELNSYDQIVVTYQATTDKATPINLTNHAYWNLSGNCRARIYDQVLQLSCGQYLPVPNDGTQIPTGELRDVTGSLFDFTSPRTVRGAALGLDGDGTGRAGLDHCFVVDGALDPATGQYQYDPAAQRAVASVAQGIAQGRYLRHVATLTEPVSRRRMAVHATQPGVQVYSANWLDNTGLSDAPDQSAHPKFPHIMHNGLCLETQHFPDAVNQSMDNTFFPGVVLRPDGEPYFHQAVFSFDIAPSGV